MENVNSSKSCPSTFMDRLTNQPTKLEKAFQVRRVELEC